MRLMLCLALMISAIASEANNQSNDFEYTGYYTMQKGIEVFVGITHNGDEYVDVSFEIDPARQSTQMLHHHIEALKECTKGDIRNAPTLVLGLSPKPTHATASPGQQLLSPGLMVIEVICKKDMAFFDLWRNFFQQKI